MTPAPKKDAQVAIDKRGTTYVVRIAGRVDEAFDYAPLAPPAGTRELAFDLGAVSLINSIGVFHWIEFLRSVPTGVRTTYARCPVPFVNQLNLIPALVTLRPFHLSSFFGPYFCEACDASQEQLLSWADFPTGDYSVAPQRGCPTCGQAMQFDAHETHYLAFLATAVK